MDIAFIGLGQLGWPIAERLLDQGYALSVFDVSREALEKAQQRGARIAPNASAAAKKASVVFTCLPDTATLIETIELLFSNMAIGAIVADLSTTTPLVAQKLAATGEKFGIAFADCPVSGGVAAAKTGTLCTMIGAMPAVYTQLDPFLSAFTQYRHHLGPPGSGQAAKLAHQLLFSSLLVALREAKTLAESFGIAKKELFEVLGHCVAPNQVLDMLSFFMKHPAPSGGLALIEKDLALIEETARHLDLQLEMLEKTKQIFTSFQHANPDEHDLFSIVLK